MANIKPTFKDPISPQSQEFEKDFKKTMVQNGLQGISEDELNEVDSMLSEVEQSLKKKIFSLAKMESLVFSDPKLSTVYDGMAENGEEKYGYHYNETIMNMIFNDYVLNSPQYIQKYKMAIPKEKKRRDKSGINQLKKAGAKKMDATGTKLEKSKEVDEEIDNNFEELNGVQESTSAGSAGGAAGYVGYAGPSAFSNKGDLSSDFKGKKKSTDPKAKPISTGYAVSENNYLTDPSGFEKYVEALNEEIDVVGSNLEQSEAYHGNPNNHGFSKYDDYVAEIWNLLEDKYGMDNNSVTKLLDTQSSFLQKKYGDGENPDNVANELSNMNGLNEKAKSKSQQQFMGMVHAYQKGELKDDEVSDAVKKAANSMTDKAAEDFASTKHKNLPDHVDESVHDTVEYHSKRQGEEPFELNGIKWQFVNAKYPDGKIDIGVYRYGHDLVYDYAWWRDAMGINENAEKNGGIPQRNKKIKEDTQTMIGDNGTSMSNKSQATGDMSSEVPMGAQDTGGLNENENEKLSDLTVLKSAAGYYVGKTISSPATFGVPAPYSRDSEYFSDEASAEEALKDMNNNNYNQDSEEIYDPVRDANNAHVSPHDRMYNSDAWVQAQKDSGMNESDMKLLEDINNELKAFSIHHNKLKIMAENKKTPSMVQGDRLRGENPKNFKKDLQHSGTKDIIDVEKELLWKDQQTDVPKDPQKLAQDIEKNEIKNAGMKSGDALKNIGNSTNNEGDEIPKRNLTTKEQEEVNLYRNGQHSLVYDNEPDERFIERQKADQGEFFEMGEKQKEFKAGAPLYNKEEQPVGDTKVDKEQFDKNVKPKGSKSPWNERMGLGSNIKLAESTVTGRYINVLGKSVLIEFKLNDVNLIESVNEDTAKLSFAGLGNTYMGRTVDGKVVVNETVTKAMDSHQFYTDGKAIFAVPNPVKNLTESDNKEKPVINEQQEKMKHLLGYKPNSYVNTNNVKKNRGF